jgi:hypothetical protein
VIVIVGDKQYIISFLNALVELYGLNWLVDGYLQGGLGISKFPSQSVESGVEVICWEEVADGYLVVLVVLGQLHDDISGDSAAGSDDVETHFKGSN